MRADVDLLAKDDAGVKIVEKDGGPGVSVDQAFLDGGELFAPTEVVLDLSDQGIERLARGGAPVKPFDVEQLGSHRTMRATTANRFELDNIRHSEPLSQSESKSPAWYPAAESIAHWRWCASVLLSLTLRYCPKKAG